MSALSYRLASLVAVTLLSATSPIQAAPLTSGQAPQHVGEYATVCGVVASTKYAPQTRRQPTFLNFDAPYPRQVFTVVIWGVDRPKFASPESAYLGKRVCASGTIELYRGKPEIVVSDPGQLR
jgi:hypothetical protein